MLEKDPLVKFIWYLKTDMIQQDPIVQNPRKGSFNTTAETSIRKWSAWNQAVCIQKEPQHRDSSQCCWWSSQKCRWQAGLSAGFARPQCGIWHAGPSYIVTEAWDHIWYFWHCASLVCILLRGPWTVCDGWRLFLSQPPSVWGSTGFSPWANSVHIVLSAPLWLDMLPWVWLPQICWWYAVVKGGSSWSVSVSSLWYPDLHWKSCRLGV